MENQNLHYLLEQMVKDINRSYLPGTVEKNRSNPALWDKVKGLERRMNHAVSAGDQRTLERVIGQYRKIWRQGGDHT
jgi:ABC-type phosphate transport system ATPase subunit